MNHHLKLLQEDEVAPVVPQATPRAGAKKGPEVQDAGTLTLGVYTLQPATAALAVGAKQTISVTFNAVGAQICLQQVGIDISDRWPTTFLTTLAASRPQHSPPQKGKLNCTTELTCTPTRKRLQLAMTGGQNVIRVPQLY